ncbi:MAG TPA: TetR family transcriptional regulator [Caulobacteraceae bacterium]|nr:TetR family transcriptional regulator [Caulobacteraceae bacterium]
MARKAQIAAGGEAASELEHDSRGERTRKQIKQAIARLVSRKDVSEINLAEICKAADVTTGALYFHFKNKDDAIEEMIIDEVREVNAARLAAMTGETFADHIKVILTLSSRFHRAKKRLPRAIGVVINSRPGAYEAWLAARRPVISRLEEAIVRERQLQGLRPDPAPYLAHFILNSLEDLALDLYQFGNPTLTPFAKTSEDWNARQAALWSWAILAPFTPAA